VTGRLTAIAAAVVLGLLLAACQTSTAGSPNATDAAGGSTTVTATSGSGGGAPSLTRPELDTAAFEAAPCSTLTEAQVAELGISVAGRDETDELGPSCRWPDLDGPAKVSLGIDFTVHGRGLEGLYTTRESKEVFEPVEVAGYPAVINLPADTRDMGTCRLSIGVNVRTVLSVDLQLRHGVGAPPDYRDPCSRAHTIAEHAVDTLKGAN